MNNHHPSCRPNDASLVWHCSQCGLNESVPEFASEEVDQAMTFVEWARDPRVRMESGARAHMVAQTLAAEVVRLRGELGKRK